MLPVQNLRCDSEFFTSLGDIFQKGLPLKSRSRFTQDKVDILRETIQAMQNPQTRPTLKGCHLKKPGAPQSKQDNFLHDFLERILFLNLIGDSVFVQALLN